MVLGRGQFETENETSTHAYQDLACVSKALRARPFRGLDVKVEGNFSLKQGNMRGTNTLQHLNVSLEAYIANMSVTIQQSAPRAPLEMI